MGGEMVNDGGTERGGGGCYAAPSGGSTHIMLISKLKNHFPARLPEWFNAGILASWGAYVILHPELFTQEATRHVFATMADMVWIDYEPSAVWGLVALSVGLTRASALFINGAYSKTPIVRLIMSAISAFVWAQMVIGLMGIANTELIVYSWLVVIDIASAYRAGIDIAVAEKHRRDDRSGVPSSGNRDYSVG